MQSSRRTKTARHAALRTPHARRGLAPLELTLTLPILVMMMALMIDFGVVGAWKVRTQANTRYAAWRTITTRTGEDNPTPPYWPATAPLTTQAGVNLPNVSQLWNAQPDLLCPCVRGPQLTAPSATAAVNVPGRLDMDSSVLEGNALLDKPLPLLRGAIPGTGRFRFNLHQDILDNHWQFTTLNIPYNDTIRALVWWDIEHSDLAALDQAIAKNKQLLDQNLQRLQTSPQRPNLYPLDADDEFNRYFGYVDYQNYSQNNGTLSYDDYLQVFPNHSPDFYPRLGRVCMSDPDAVYISAVSRLDQDGHPNPKSLLSRIDRLPCTMSHRFTDMYRTWICELEKCGFPDGQIDPLRQRYKDLAQFGGKQGCGIGNLPQRCTCPPMTTCTCPPSPVGVGH